MLREKSNNIFSFKIRLFVYCDKSGNVIRNTAFESTLRCNLEKISSNHLECTVWLVLTKVYIYVRSKTQNACLTPGDSPQLSQLLPKVNTSLFSVTQCLFSRISHRWNCAVCMFWCLASVIRHTVLGFIHAVGCYFHHESNSIKDLQHILLICFSVGHLRLFSILEVLWIKPLWTLMYKFNVDICSNSFTM